MRRPDLLIAAVLALVASLGSWKGSGQLDARIFTPDADALVDSGTWEGVFVQPRSTDRIWFGADTSNLFLTFAEPHYNLRSTAHYPLIALAARLPVRSALLTWPEFDPVTVVRLFMAFVSAVWSVTFFCGLRLIPLSRVEALVMSSVALTSASAMFWLTVPSPSVFASVGTLLIFATVAAAERFKVPAGWFVIAGAVAFCFTRTSWILGALGTAMSHPWRRTVQLTANAFAVVLVLWALEKFVFPTSIFPFLLQRPLFSHYEVDVGRVIGTAGSLVDGVVFPFPNSIFSAIAISSWLLLLGIGFWAIFSIKEHARVRWFLASAFFYLLAVQVIRGGEMFRWSLHITPLLIAIAALAVLTRWRRLALALGMALAISAGIHNALQFERAAAAATMSAASSPTSHRSDAVGRK